MGYKPHRHTALNQAVELAKLELIGPDEVVRLAGEFHTFLKGPVKVEAETAEQTPVEDPEEFVYFYYGYSEGRDKDGFPTALYRTRRKDLNNPEDKLTDARYAGAVGSESENHEVVVKFAYLSGTWSGDLDVYTGPIPPEFREYDYFSDGDADPYTYVWRFPKGEEEGQILRGRGHAWDRAYTTREEMEAAAEVGDEEYKKLTQSQLPEWARD